MLAFFYLGTSLGAGVQFHYCMNELVEASFFSNSDEGCPECGMEESSDNNCCRDEHKQLKIKDDHKLAASIGFELPPFSQAQLPEPLFLTASVAALQQVYLRPFGNAPPLASSIPGYLLHRTFRI